MTQTFLADRTKSSPSLKVLEEILHIPVLEINALTFTVNANLWANGKLDPRENAEFGILVRIDDQPNVIKKLLSLMSASLRVRRLTFEFTKQGATVIGKYGVYPNIEDPVTVYELNSCAGTYVNNNVLPGFSSGLSGKLRKLIMKLTKFHPSLAGIILVARKN